MELSKCVKKNIARIGSLKVKPAAKPGEKSALKYLCTKKKKENDPDTIRHMIW